MIREPKQQLLFRTVFLIALLSFGAYAFLISNVHAAGMTTEQKSLTILNDVVGLDLTKYATSAKEYPQDSYFGVVPRENVGYDLTAEGSKLRVLYSFVDSHLQMMHVLESEGSPRVTKSAVNAVAMAKDFLNKYQAYSADSLYGELKSTLENVDARKNVTKTSGNTQLEVISVRDWPTGSDTTTFKWTYTFNGVKAPSKFIALGFKNGFLSCFVDNWNLYRIGSTSVTLSKEDAIAIALETAKAYSWSIKLDDDALEAKNFNESNVRWAILLFDKSLQAVKPRSEDLLMLYPVWRVGIALDKWYGNLYGIEVDIWADTKEVRYVQEAWSTLPPPGGVPTANMSAVGGSTSQVSDADTTNSLNGQVSVVAGAEPNSIVWIALPALAAAIIGTAAVWVSRKRNSRSYNLLKPRSFKTGGILLCILISSIILLVPMATVKADMQRGGSVVWGSESTGDSWRKHATEIAYQRSISSAITSYFSGNGYSGFNLQGNGGSLKSNILYNIQVLQNNYARVAVVDFDHGVGNYLNFPGSLNEFHYMFEDNVGTYINGVHHPENGVYDYEIYPLTASRKIFFAFINTCMSANLTTPSPETGQGFVQGTNRARGLPFAFTHRYVKYRDQVGFNVATDISDDGYSHPDSGTQCYIGFPYGAASLMQRIPYDYGQLYYCWVNFFFYCALTYDMSINDALDHASWEGYGLYFSNCPLRTGFTCYWLNFPLRSDCTMAVYGNGRIGLKLHSLTVPAYDNYGSPVTANVYIDGEYRGTTGNTFVVTSGSHSLRFETSSNIFHYFTGYPEFNNPITVSVTQDRTVTANYYANPPPQYSLSISAGAGGSTSPSPGNYQYTPQRVTVTANPNSVYVFDYWLLDGTPHAENPISVPMSSDHTLQANFRVQTTCWLTVYAGDMFTGTPLYPSVYIDGYPVGTAPGPFLVQEGWHDVGVESPVWNWYDNYYDYFYMFSNNDCSNPTRIEVTYDTWIVAGYIPW